MSSRQRPTRTCISSSNEELNSFITFSQDDPIQTSSTPPKSKGEILRERALSRTSERSSNSWFLDPSMRTTSITESVEHEDDDDDDIADFSSQNTNTQDDGRHSDIQSFGDQSEEHQEDQQTNDGRRNFDKIHEANTKFNKKAQVPDNDDVNKRMVSVPTVIASLHDRDADTFPYNPEERLENDTEADTLPYDSKESFSNDSDAETLPYDPEGSLPDDENDVYEADTAPYNLYDSLPQSPVVKLAQTTTAVSPEALVLPSTSSQGQDDDQSNADSVDFFEDSQFVVFSPTEQSQHQEIQNNNNNMSAVDGLDEFDPDISDDELLGSPLYIEQQQKSSQLFSIPAIDNPPQVLSNASSLKKSSLPPTTEQPENISPIIKSKQSSIYEGMDSFMDGMVSSLSTCKSSPAASQHQQQQHLSLGQKQSSLLDYSRVVKSPSILQPNQSSQDSKKSFPQHILLPNKKSDNNSYQKTLCTRRLSQSSNSSTSTHKYTLSSYYPIREEEMRFDSKTPYTQEKRNSLSQCVDAETSTTSQQNQPINNNNDNNTTNRNSQSSILRQTTLPRYSSFSQSQSDHDDATLSSSRSSLRKPSIGLSRKHVISSPSKPSERDTKKHRPKLSDICKKTQPKRKKVYGLGRPSKSTI